MTWEIQVDGHSPEEAARHAKRLQAAVDTTADVYEVHAPDGEVTVVDLSALDGRVGEAEAAASAGPPTSWHRAARHATT